MMTCPQHGNIRQNSERHQNQQSRTTRSGKKKLHTATNQKVDAWAVRDVAMNHWEASGGTEYECNRRLWQSIQSLITGWILCSDSLFSVLTSFSLIRILYEQRRRHYVWKQCSETWANIQRLQQSSTKHTVWGDNWRHRHSTDHPDVVKKSFHFIFYTPASSQTENFNILPTWGTKAPPTQTAVVGVEVFNKEDVPALRWVASCVQSPPSTPHNPFTYNLPNKTGFILEYVPVTQTRTCPSSLTALIEGVKLFTFSMLW